MTRNDRNAANVPVPAWLGWKRNIFYAALAAIVSAAFIYQLTRPDSLLGGMLGWELERIDDASREGVAAPPGSITWAGLFAQLERKMPTLPDARPRAGTAQLIYAVDAVQRGRLSAVDAVARLAPAEDAATFNLVARLAYAWLRDRAEANADPSPSPTASPSGNSPPPPSTSSASPPSSMPLARYDSFSRILDAQPPATTATLYNDTLHDAWRDVLKTAIRRQDVIASCVRNYRHFDIREHYAALPTIHATFSSLARELHTAGHAPQAETIRQWLDHAYAGLIDAERDYATRLLAAELLTDVRAADFYTAAPNHHRPSKLRDAFHEHASNNPADMVDLYKSPLLFTSHQKPYRILAFCIGAAAVTAGYVIALFCRLLAGVVRLPEANPDLHTLVYSTADLWGATVVPIALVLGLGWFCGTSQLVTGHSGSTEGYLLRLAAASTTTALLLIAISARLACSRVTLPITITQLLAVSTLLVVWVDPSLSAWPTFRKMDIGIGAVFTIGSIFLLLIFAAIVITAASARVAFAVAVRGWLISATFTMVLIVFQPMNEKSIRLSTDIHRGDIINARIGHAWRSCLPQGVNYETSQAPKKN